MRALESLPRSWLSVDLPGYRPHPERATYSAFPYADLPPARRALDDLGWLRELPAVPESLAEASDPAPERPATAKELELLLEGTRLRPPPSFRAFVGAPELQSRIRSCTLCYLDLGHFPVPVTAGGWLVHVLSDSQWVLHWLLYGDDDDDAEAVVVTDLPLGFELDGETVRKLDPREGGAAICAESFAEFLWRFRIENEIWFALVEDGRPLTDEEREYVRHYEQLRA